MLTCIRNLNRSFSYGAKGFCGALILWAVPAALSMPSPARAEPANAKSTGYLGELTDEMVPPPRAGLGSNHNYYLYNGGKPIHGLVVTVEVTKDIICDDIGFHIQLNAYSPKDDNIHTVFQQYVMGWASTRNFLSHPRRLSGVRLSILPSPTISAHLRFTRRS